jgi:hypothetical protein
MKPKPGTILFGTLWLFAQFCGQKIIEEFVKMSTGDLRRSYEETLKNLGTSCV